VNCGGMGKVSGSWPKDAGGKQKEIPKPFAPQAFNRFRGARATLFGQPFGKRESRKCTGRKYGLLYN